MATPSSQIFPGWTQGPNGWTYTPQQNPQGTLGVPQQYGPGQAPGSGQQSSNFGQDILDTLGGHAAYAPGGQFGGNATTNTYAQGASQLGLGQAQSDQAIGNANQGALDMQGRDQQRYLSMMGSQFGNNFVGLGNNLGAVSAPTVNMSGANIAAANQANALGMYGQAAAGNGPSAAQAQLQAGLQQSIQAQQAEAASARGGFGLANAQHDAAINSGQLAGNAANAAAQLRAQEQQAGMAGYAGLASTAEAQQAQNAMGIAGIQQQQQFQNAANQLNAYGQAANANLGYQNAGVNANLGYQQLGLGNQLAYNQLGQGNQLSYNQLGQQAMGQQLSADVSNQQAANQQMAGNAQRGQQAGGGLLSMVGGLFGGL